jgi:hypothetical protein
VEPLQIRQFVCGSVEAYLKSLDSPSHPLSRAFCDPLFQVADNGNESWSRGWVQSKARASDARLTEMILK